jgi:SAM-dependent methyltransferase
VGRVTIDHYAGSAANWAADASLVYGPIARDLVDTWPGDLTGRVILDAGAGTGVVTDALVARGAEPVAADLSHDMLRWRSETRPPSVVADICALPLADGSVDDAVAAFVLNHLSDPAPGFAELVRVTRPGGSVRVCVYNSSSSSQARDLVDQVILDAGWQVPDWYVELKTAAVPVLGNPGSMEAAARAAGLDRIDVSERAVDVGVTTAEQLVRYRLGQAQFATWLSALTAERSEAIRERAAREVRPVMQPYCPTVVYLAATRSLP